MATVDVSSPEKFIEELEEIRTDFRKEYPFRTRDTRTKEQWAASKRKSHQGGDNNHTFVGEQYLNCPDKEMRRHMLGKLLDEGGQVAVGGKIPSHPTLSRWESYAVGLTPEEIDKLQSEDAPADQLIQRAWRINLCRTAHFSLSIGSSLVGEGENRIHTKELLEDVKEVAKRFREWGVKDLNRSLLNKSEHAGVDVDHAMLAEDAIKLHANTPELREQMRNTFIIRIQQTGGF